jgi:putative protein-disulfide isomerase
MQPTLLYIQDALCGWCYGFSPVVQKLYDNYKDRIVFDVLSGGMVSPEHAQPVSVKAKYVAEAYKTVEQYSGVKFGEAYLKHYFKPEESTWIEESLTPATALSLLKAAQPISQDGGKGGTAVSFSRAIQDLHMKEGKDLSDPKTYRDLATSINLDEEEFMRRLKEEEWQEEARYEFALVKQLGITGFPAVVLQTASDKFYLLARGYTAYEDLSARLDRALAEMSRL